MRTIRISATDSRGVLLDIITIKVPETTSGFGIHMIGPGHGDDPGAIAELTLGIQEHQTDQPGDLGCRVKRQD